jgi:amino acid adenylation domain-containing protein
MGTIEEVDVLEPSSAQLRLWFLAEGGGADAYNIPVAIRLRGELDPGALGAALRECVRRHEALRTAFAIADGRLVQLIADEAGIDVEVRNVSALELPEAEIDRIVTTEAARPFTLERPPLARALLLRVGLREHVFVLTIHHLVADGWSVALLTHELAELYAAFAAGRPSPLAEPPLQYGDFAQWQNAQVTAGAFDQQLAAWRERLSGGLPILDLPTDHPRRPLRRYRGGRCTLELPAETVAGVHAVARRHGATEFMVLLAAFGALLHRCSGQDDMVVGTPVAGRGRSELEGCVGLLVNSVALRLAVGGDLSFAQLLDRVREVAVDAFADQDVPFERVVEAVSPPRDPSRNPLFDVMFVLQGAVASHAGPAGTDGVSFERFDVSTGTAKLDLVLTVSQAGRDRHAVLEYDRDLFEHVSAERLLRRFTLLLGAAVREPGRPLWSLPLLLDDETRDLVRVERPLNHAAARLRRLHELVDAQADRWPDRVAVTDERGSSTYRELEAQANRLAHHLIAAGLGREDRVALLLDRSSDAVAAILATLKSGAAYVPLDIGDPASRLERVVGDADPALLLTTRELADRVPGVPVLLLDEEAEAIAARPVDRPAVRGSADDLAYVIYTSGSTGQPKGVAIPHANVVRLLESTGNLMGLGPSDVHTLFHSLAFDISVWEVFAALTTGARLIVVPSRLRGDMVAVRAVLAREQVTMASFTPSGFAQLVDVECSHAGGGRLALRTVVLGGEAVRLQRLAPWFERFGDHEPTIVNLYGITETTVHATFRPLRRADVERPDISPIGRPLGHLDLQLLDAHGQPVPYGVVAEICIGGGGLARGYLNRPDLTSQRFVAHPYPATPGERIYRSGDLARWRHDGGLDYIGRADTQVKVRGFRIETGEVEAAVNRHPAVAAAAVVAVRHDEGTQLAAYWTPAGQQRPSTSELRAFCARILPDHMIPSAFTELAALPLTKNGKIDTRALPQPELRRPRLDSPCAAAETTAQTTLAEVWAEVLRVERVGLDDNFFELGGDSIQSLRARALAHDRGLDFELEDLFQGPTVRELALATRAVAPGGAGPDDSERITLLPPADRARLPEGIEDAYPMSVLQQGMLYHTQARGDATIFHDIETMTLSGDLDVDALLATLQWCVDRHPTLRTGFDLATYSVPLQLVHGSARPQTEIKDLRHLDERAQRAALAEWRELQRRTPFEVARPPLIRFAVHRLDAHRFELSCVFHHAVLDGWSLATLFGDALRAYVMRHRTGATPDAAPLRTTPRDHVALERLALADPSERVWWREQIARAPTATLARRLAPLTGGEEAELTAVEHGVDQQRLYLRLDAGVTGGLRRLARAAAVPLKSVLLAAHLKTLALFTGEQRVVTGLIANGRPETADGDRVLGMFLNTVPLVAELRAGTWSDLARTALDAERAVLTHRWYPMGRMYRDTGRARLFEASFNFTHYHAADAVPDDDALKVIDGASFEPSDLECLFNCSVNPVDGQLRVWLAFDRRVWPVAETGPMAVCFRRVLEAAAAGPSARHDTHELLRDAGRAVTSRRRPAAAAGGDSGDSLAVRVAGQARQRPGAVALGDGSAALTYAQLDRRARQIAQALVAAGVRPHDRVGLRGEHSLALPCALMGILYAGAAYVALDPALPPARTAALAEAAAVSVVVGDPATLAGVPAHLRRVDAHEVAPSGQGLPVPVAPDAPAYIAFTSGSSGEPKPVVVSNANVAALFAATQHEVPTGPDDVWSVAHSLAFDFSVWELFGALLHGGRAVVVPRWTARSPADLWRLVRAEAVTVLSQTPTAFAGLAEHAEGAAAALRLVVLGGEPLRAASVDRWYQRFGAAAPALVNMYGTTETTVHATAHRLDPALGGLDATVIGRPLAHLSARVLDRDGAAVPVGVPGELLLAGPGVASGYSGRADLEAERFATTTRGLREYRTGDRVRWLPDGQLEYLGRVDDQLEIRGHRIEPREVEAALERIPGVTAAAIAPTPDGDPPQLAAYLVVSGDDRPTVSTLRRRMREQVPDHLVPARWLTVAALPTGPNGKLDRRRLTASAAVPVPRDTPYAGPRNHSERELAELYADVLGVRPVGVHDNFFDMGGDSLRALRVAARLDGVSVRTVMERPTVAELSLRCGHAWRQASRPPETSPATPRDPAPHARIERRPLLDLVSCGEIAPIDAAALATAPDRLRRLGLDGTTMRSELFDHHPVLSHIYDGPLGRIGVIVLPVFDVELYTYPSLVTCVEAALRLAGEAGARHVSLTGLIPSATGYARELPSGGDLPVVTTGHAATAAAVLLSSEGLLAHAGRRMAGERLGVLGLGSVGLATLRLLLAEQQHPQELLLCDVAAKRDVLRRTAAEAGDRFGFTGRVRTLVSNPEVPDDLYTATTIVGASNAPDVLDVERLAPGCLLVDDSSPPCFDVERGLARVERSADILVSEAGSVRAPSAFDLVRYIPPRVQRAVERSGIEPASDDRFDPRSIGACVLSGLLMSHCADLTATVGDVGLADAVRHRLRLRELGFGPAPPHSGGRLLPPACIGAFQRSQRSRAPA